MNQRAEDAFRADIVEVGRRMYARGYVASNDGNISVRLDDDTDPDDAEERVEGIHDAGHDGRHGSRRQEDRAATASLVRAADAPRGLPQPAGRAARWCTRIRRLATGFAVAGIPLDRAVLAEVVTTLGSIPIAEYATPSTAELPDAVRKYIKAHDGLLLANHGALTRRRAISSRAYYKMETIEHFAKISLVARQLGAREPDVARRSGAAAGPARQVRHRLAGADLRRSATAPPAARWICQVVEASESRRPAARARADADV